MQKPINLLINDIKKEMLQVLGKDQLPLTVISMLVNELNNSITKQLEQVVIKETFDYEESLKKEKESKTKIK